MTVAGFEPATFSEYIQVNVKETCLHCTKQPIVKEQEAKEEQDSMVTGVGELGRRLRRRNGRKDVAVDLETFEGYRLERTELQSNVG